jgi:hypothetical protein
MFAFPGLNVVCISHLPHACFVSCQTILLHLISVFDPIVCLVKKSKVPTLCSVCCPQTPSTSLLELRWWTKFYEFGTINFTGDFNLEIYLEFFSQE